MEVRSSRRMRTLVTQMVHRGLSVNENARALISMMARSKCSNQRPDTLMQDRSPLIRRNLLATRGRTIHSGQSRQFDRARLTSGLPRIADLLSVRRHVSKVPTSDMLSDFYLILARANSLELLNRNSGAAPHK